MMNRFFVKNFCISLIILIIFLSLGIIYGTNIGYKPEFTDSEISGFSGTVYYFKHNLIFILVAVVGLFSLSIPTLIMLIYNGFVFGLAIGIALNAGVPIFEVILKLTHGIFEIPALLIASGIGLGGIKFYSLKNKKESIIFNSKLLGISLIFLLIAAIWEANLTDILVKLIK